MTLLAAPAARAHDAQRQKHIAGVDIKAPAASVWAVIGHFHDLSWDPDVASVTGDGGDEVGAKRGVIFKSGRQWAEEELTRYVPEKLTYATFLPHVDVTVFPVTNYSSILAVMPGEGATCRVEWRSGFYRGDPNFGPPPALNDEAAIKAVIALTEPPLDALKRRFEGNS